MPSRLQSGNILRLDNDILAALGRPEMVHVRVAQDGVVVIDPVTVKRVDGTEVSHRLAERGLTERAAVQLVGATVELKKTLNLHGGRVMLEAGMTGKVMNGGYGHGLGGQVPVSFVESEGPEAIYAIYANYLKLVGLPK